MKIYDSLKDMFEIDDKIQEYWNSRSSSQKSPEESYFLKLLGQDDKITNITPLLLLDFGGFNDFKNIASYDELYIQPFGENTEGDHLYSWLDYGNSGQFLKFGELVKYSD